MVVFPFLSLSLSVLLAYICIDLSSASADIGPFEVFSLFLLRSLVGLLRYSTKENQLAWPEDSFQKGIVCHYTSDINLKSVLETSYGTMYVLQCQPYSLCLSLANIENRFCI